LEQQAGEDEMLGVLERQQCAWLVVSYPTASIGGRDKGMEAHYRSRFERIKQKLGRECAEIMFPEELVFVLRRG
jgi:hypothetical protein